jgi:hypothetical protein
MPAELDGRTRAILEALAYPGADLLGALLRFGTAIERELILATGAPQATVNRRLRRFEELSVVERLDPGRPQTPGRRWRIRHPEHVRRILLTVAELAERTAQDEAAIRAELIERLQPAERKVHQLRRGGRSAQRLLAR